MCTELETIVMNWLAKMIGLPEQFMHRPGVNGGGGVIQTTASDSTLVSLLAARTRAIRDVQESDADRTTADINSRLVAYCSDQVYTLFSFLVVFFLSRQFFSLKETFCVLSKGTLERGEGWTYRISKDEVHRIGCGS